MNAYRICGAVAVLVVVCAAQVHAQESEDSSRSTLRAPAEVVKRVVVPAEIPGVTNAAKTSDGDIYFGGQPTPASVEALKQEGVKVVINLRRPEEMDKLDYDEKKAVEAAGMTYIHMPMVSTGLPTAEALKPVLAALGTADDARVFLHCGSSNRVGGVWALYEGMQGGKSADEAIAEGKKAGMRTPELEADVRKRLEGAAKQH